MFTKVLHGKIIVKCEVKRLCWENITVIFSQCASEVYYFMRCLWETSSVSLKASIAAGLCFRSDICSSCYCFGSGIPAFYGRRIPGFRSPRSLVTIVILLPSVSDVSIILKGFLILVECLLPNKTLLSWLMWLSSSISKFSRVSTTALPLRRLANRG